MPRGDKRPSIVFCFIVRTPTGKDLNMKIAIITDGSRGLGKSMSLRLAEKGHDIILTYNSKKAEAEDVKKDIKERKEARRTVLKQGLPT